MKRSLNGTCFFVLLFVISAQGRGQSPLPAPGVPHEQSPHPKGSNPKPEDATKAILAAFDKYEVVGLGAAHDNKDLDDFILHLIRNPAFPSALNDVAVECGNSSYQSILDRYIAGEDVSLSEVRPVWRNTTQAMCGESGFYEEFFPLVRRINQRLSLEKKLRVLAGDPPIDWSKVKSLSDLGLDRDASIASVMEKEVLSKHRNALMLFGIGHLYHGGSSAVGLYEKAYPGVTFVIADHMGFYNWSSFAKYNDEFEARIASWPVPSLVQELKGTWLADLGGNYFSTMADGYLYLGPRDLLLRESKPAEIVLDKDYMAELERRAAIGRRTIDRANPEKVSNRDSSPFLYDQLFKTIQPLVMDSSLSEAPPQAGPPWRLPEPPQAIHLSPEVLGTFAGKYSPDSPSGTSLPPIEVAADQNGLWVDLGVGLGKRRFVPLSPMEFMEDDIPATRIAFTKNDKGEIAGLIFKGLWTNKATKLPSM